MSLERRLSDALHEVDRLQPRPDLFARVERSIEEDRAHRRRLAVAVVAILASLSAMTLFLGVSVERDGESLVISRGAVEAMETVVLVALVAVLGPLVRRFGAIYARAAFPLEPSLPDRFLRLLDIAYYLIFFGVVLLGVELTRLDVAVPLGIALEGSARRLAVLLGTMGLTHALTLVVLPVVGLIVSAVTRRALRAGVGTPVPVSARADQADRLVTRLVWALGALAAAAGFILVGVIIGGGLGG